jgi:hypothetical protein
VLRIDQIFARISHLGDVATSEVLLRSPHSTYLGRPKTNFFYFLEAWGRFGSMATAFSPDNHEEVSTRFAKLFIFVVALVLTCRSAYTQAQAA